MTSTRLPSLTARGAPPGGTVRADLFAPSGWRQVLALSLTVDRVLLPIGDLWIDPNLFLVVDSGVMGATSHRVTQLPVPNIGALSGLPIAIQAIAGGTNVSVLSNPVVVVLY